MLILDQSVGEVFFITDLSFIAYRKPFLKLVHVEIHAAQDGAVDAWPESRDCER